MEFLLYKNSIQVMSREINSFLKLIGPVEILNSYFLSNKQWVISCSFYEVIVLTYNNNQRKSKFISNLFRLVEHASLKNLDQNKKLVSRILFGKKT